MLTQLMKYEFKAVGRIMLPLYGAWLIMSILMGLAVTILEKVVAVGIIIGFLYGAVTIACVVLTIVMVIQRFYKNLLGSEGYLMFTLPVKTASHVWNKAISAAFWIFAGVVMGLLSMGIIVMFTEGYTESFEAIRMFFKIVTGFLGAPKVVLLIVEIILLALLMTGEAALKIYAAISLGHQWGSHRILGAIGAYIGFGIVEVIITNIIFILFPNMEQDLERLFESTSDFMEMQLMMMVMALIVLVLGTVYFLVTYKMLDKRLNLE